MTFLRGFFAVLLLAIATTGCKKDDNNPVTPDPAPDRRGTYAGTVGDSAGGGAVNLTIGTSLLKTSEIIPVTGVFTPVAGSPITLSGSYNTANDSLHASGGGYTFAGHFGGGQFSGSCTGPNGAGIWTVAASTSSNPVRVYTGEFSVPGNGDNGPFNLTTRGITLSVIAFNRRNNETGQFTGTVQGNTLTVRSPERVVATGTISSDGLTVSGLTVDGNGQPTGTWSGTLVQ